MSDHPTPAFTIQRYERLAAAQREQILAIYYASFPPEERSDLAGVLADVAGNRELLYLAEDGERVWGFAILMPLSSPGMFTGEYLAVDPALRNQKLGATILEFIIDELRRQGGRGLLFEIEALDGGTPEEQIMRRRRLGFYQRHGGQIVVPAAVYRTPIFGTHDSLPMELVWLPFVAGDAPLTAAELRAGIASLYTDSLRCPPDDPRLRDILRALPRPPVWQRATALIRRAVRRLGREFRRLRRAGEGA